LKIILAGFNGTWRKETGKILSIRLKKQFFDIEEIIEEREKDRVAHISQVKGKDYLRQIEEKIVKEISCLEDIVFSVNPDVIASEENRRILKSDGIIIWLTAEPSIILLRMHPGKDSKTLLSKQQALAHIRHVLKEHDFSVFADRIVDTSELTPEQTADRVQQILINSF